MDYLPFFLHHISGKAIPVEPENPQIIHFTLW